MNPRDCECEEIGENHKWEGTSLQGLKLAVERGLEQTGASNIGEKVAKPTHKRHCHTEDGQSSLKCALPY